MISLLVLADDFTGALDTGVQFVKQGIKTEVLTVKDLDFTAYDTDVLVINTETRHLSGSEAFAIISNFVKKAKEAGVKYVYKKTDSALRGNIGAELEAALSAFNATRLAFLPAYPQISRTTENGVQYIDGVAVNESHFGRDPYEPVKNAAIKDIVAEQSKVAVYNVTDLNDALPQDAGILVFDAKTTDDLIAAGKKALLEEKIAVSAGCAGFATFLPELLNIKPSLQKKHPLLSPKFLTICGSVNPITLAQLKFAQEHGFARISLTPEEKLNADFLNSEIGKKLLVTLGEQIKLQDKLIIESNDAGDHSNNAPTKAYAENNGLTSADIRERISWTMGHIAKAALDLHLPLTLLLTGGDTLLKCMKCANVTKLEPICEIEDGVVLAAFYYQNEKVNVITKSGGFGPEDLLVKIAATLKQ